jgi:hypothetical protein
LKYFQFVKIKRTSSSEILKNFKEPAVFVKEPEQHLVYGRCFDPVL